jgi:hypothetical protein
MARTHPAREKIDHSTLKKSIQRAARSLDAEMYAGGHVEVDEQPRTKLGGFFSVPPHSSGIVISTPPITSSSLKSFLGL